ncbi:hypothetical protein [Listeria booriae]|uniref:sunset domain-containing protein n=1 Tax=Listeria booriae TaxID=1552123 RepID=UPI001C8A43D4
MKPAQTVLKKGNLLLIILMLFISMTSFHQPAQAAEPLTVGVLARSDVEGNNVNIHVQTNLPNKMKFFATITGPNGYNEEIKLKVKKDGKLKKTIGELDKGSYEIKFQSYQPKKQTDSMRKIIGKKGGNLEGDLVNKKKVIKFTETINITTPSEKELQKAAAEKQARIDAENAEKERVAKEEQAAKEKEAAEQKANEEKEREQQEAQDSAPAQEQGQIKGSYSGIYHVPGSTYYDRTTNVKEWFNTVAEAEAAGYRAPKR